MKFTSTCFFAALILSTACMFAEPQAAQPSPKKKATRVITDEDIPSSSSSSRGSSAASQPAASSEEPAPSSSASSSTPAPASKSKTPKSDNPELAALQSRLDELENDEANLVSGNDSLKQDLAKEEDPKRREVLQNMLTNRQRSLERAKSERSDINRKIDTLTKK